MTPPDPTGPLLTTERLELWLPQRSDIADMVDLTFDAETRRYLGGFVPDERDSFTRLTKNAGSWALWGYGVFAVRLKGQPRIIGSCGVFRSHRGFGPDLRMDNVAEAGWIIHRDYWGLGLARETMDAVLDWFDQTHGLQRIGCMIERGNTASDALARRLGFVPYASHVLEDDAEVVLYDRG